MTSPLNMVALAAGDVRVSIDELKVSERLLLLRKYANLLDKHYSNGHKGGTGFRAWHSNNFDEPLSTDSVRRYFIQEMDTDLYPNEPGYDSQTRVATLSADYVLLPEFKEPKADWKLGDVQLLTRFCLTNVGDLYLEWYEGKVTQMNREHSSMPERITVTSAEYHRIPLFDRLTPAPFEEKALERINTVLRKRPWQLVSFAQMVLNLIADEAEQKERAAVRSKDLFNNLNTLGHIFGITRTQ